MHFHRCLLAQTTPVAPSVILFTSVNGATFNVDCSKGTVEDSSTLTTQSRVTVSGLSNNSYIPCSFKSTSTISGMLNVFVFIKKNNLAEIAQGEGKGNCGATPVNGFACSILGQNDEYVLINLSQSP